MPLNLGHTRHSLSLSIPLGLVLITILHSQWGWSAVGPELKDYIEQRIKNPNTPPAEIRKTTLDPTIKKNIEAHQSSQRALLPTEKKSELSQKRSPSPELIALKKQKKSLKEELRKLRVSRDPGQKQKSLEIKKQLATLQKKLNTLRRNSASLGPTSTSPVAVPSQGPGRTISPPNLPLVPSREAVVIDGSQIPTEIEFGAKKKAP